MYWIGPAWYQDPHVHGKAQAQFFYDTMKRIHGNDMGELPPVIDIEDTNAPKGHRTIQSIKAFMGKTKELWGREPMVYTAGWWFDVWFSPYYSPEKFGGWDIYSYDLWEADPPPDTKCGEWTETDVTQVKLSIKYPGFNAVIDVNETTQEWIDSAIAIEKFYTQEEVDTLLKELEVKLTIACNIRCALEFKAGWNEAVQEVLKVVRAIEK